MQPGPRAKQSQRRIGREHETLDALAAAAACPIAQAHAQHLIGLEHELRRRARLAADRQRASSARVLVAELQLQLPELTGKGGLGMRRLQLQAEQRAMALVHADHDDATEQEAQQQRDAVASARESRDIANNRYLEGASPYLQVLAAQAIALANERNQLEIERRRMAASVLLIKALGGGWSESTLPKFSDLR